MGNNVKNDKLNALAKDVILLSRNTLLVNLRFLDMALSRLEPTVIESYSIMTDGRHLFYNPVYVLSLYKNSRELSVRSYLHSVMHCVFRHMIASPTVDRLYWDCACDIAVENVISTLSLRSCETPAKSKQAEIIDLISKQTGILTAEKIYAYLKKAYADPQKLLDIRKPFLGDEHDVWYMSEEEKGNKIGISFSNDAESRMAIAEDWEQISRRMQTELETFFKHRGTLSGELLQNLMAVNREKYDYSAFLKKFAVMGEAMKINDDEFDYIFYTYGLQLYEKMPLIEPLEYKEIKAIKEFVVAIDTSGSTSGETVQNFVQKTYNILKSTESFHTRINLHIIQCDADIQEDKKITCQEDFDEYLKTMKIRGLGGTDFRPVFEYVEQLRKNKEFTNLKGLIYFTDGYGAFPAKKPDYDTAFVFIDDEYNNPDVPPWAIKLILQKDEI